MPSITDTNFPSGRKLISYTTQVTRSQTSNQESGLFLPIGFMPTMVEVYGQVASDASGTATISVGSTNSTTGVFVSAFNVKTNGVGQAIPSTAAVLGVTLAAVTPVTVKYEEGGTASTAGGPWTVVISGLQV